MINITNKVDCCGCQACGDICGKKAITFKTDEEGIWYPVVDKAKCVDCGLCEKVCPIINNTKCISNSMHPECYVLQAPEAYDRLQSASGAAYTLLARTVFKKGGYIAGHIWDKEFGVKGYISGTPEDLEILRGTKYLQSNVEGIYSTVRKLLNEGRYVLFSGTPCQNAAMRAFLRKDYDNLIMTDFVCMGIDSPLAFKKYIESLERKYQSRIIYFKAKSKEVGWRYLTNKAIFENGSTYFGINGRDANLNATFLDILVRPSCYDCRFKGFPRVSDITIGDYWRKKHDYDPLDDNTGTSYVMLHNQKAIDLFQDVKISIDCREVDYNTIVKGNPYANRSLPRPCFDRSEFYRRLSNEDFSHLVEGYYHNKNTNTRRSVLMSLKQLIRASFFYRKAPLSFIRFLYYNFMCSKIKTNFLNGDILIIRNSKIKLAKSSIINVKGICIIDSITPSILTIGDDARLSLDNNVIGGGCLITAEDNAEITLGFKTIIKNFVKINARTGITIGEFSVVGDRVTIDDANQGIVYFNEKNIKDKRIVLGTHVLLNTGSVVLCGSTIMDETIVKEYTVTQGTYEPRSVIQGNPGKVIDRNIYWKHNFENILNYKN